MGIHVFFAALSAPLLVMALLSSRRGHRSTYLIWKLGASVLFLASAWSAPWNGPFDRLLFWGLAAHAVGDVLIAWPTQTGRLLFPVSIGSFLAGHVLYFLAFQANRELWDLTPGLLAVACVVNFSVFLRIRKRMGKLVIPGFLYTLALMFMSAAALTAAFRAATAGESLGAWLIGVGGVVYNASDGAVIRERFVQASFTNKLWGLPAYYAAQHVLVFAMLLM